MEDTQSVLEELLEAFPDLEKCRESIQAAFVLLRDCLAAGNKLVLCGNGGSCADCDHLAGGLLKGFCRARPLEEEEKAFLRRLEPGRGELLAKKLQKGLAAVNLCGHTAVMTAVANDTDGELIFAQQLMGLGQKGDVLVCVCPRGSAENILNAIMAARLRGMKVLGLTAQDGGKMRELCDVLIPAPAAEIYRTQEYHLPIYHALCRMLEAAFFEA